MSQLKLGRNGINGVKSEKELLKSRLQKLVKLLDYKNRTHCKKYLNGIIKDFF